MRATVIHVEVKRPARLDLRMEHTCVPVLTASLALTAILTQMNAEKVSIQLIISNSIGGDNVDYHLN